MPDNNGTGNQGFASMSEQDKERISSEGGKAAHAKGTAHEFTSEEARTAGKKSSGGRRSNSSNNS